MGRFNGKTFFDVALYLSTVIVLASAYGLPEKKEAGVRLAHLCVHPVTDHEKGPPVIMMHGLNGAKENWNGIFQPISFLTGRRVCIYDARNHGDSEWNDSFTIDYLAEDLGNFMQAKNIEKAALVGHSLGGLTAMRFALKNPNKVEKFFTEDIGPRFDPKEENVSILPILKLLFNSLTVIPENADEVTAKKAVADFLIKNLNMTADENFYQSLPLVFRDGAWQWKSNIRAFIKAFEDSDSVFGKMEGRYDGEAFFIYGEDSPYQVGSQKELIEKLFPNSKLLGIAGAGHVIHPYFRRFLTELTAFLK